MHIRDQIVRVFWLAEFDSWQPKFKAEAIAPPE